jgi:hypothetical protein
LLFELPLRDDPLPSHYLVMLVERTSTEVTKGSLSNVESSFFNLGGLSVAEMTAQAEKPQSPLDSASADGLGDRRRNEIGRWALNPGRIDTGYVVHIGRVRLDVGVDIRCLGAGQ